MSFLFIFFFMMVTLSKNVASQDVDPFIEDSKTDLLIVISGGLGGAILGLSTLSFVDEPRKHTRNITVGAALGVIAGVAFVAVSQADKSKSQFYQEEASSDFDFPSRRMWHEENNELYTSLESTTPFVLNYQILF
jgi:hypothetical protein